MKTCLRLILALIILAAPASVVSAKQKPAPTAPGKYTEWAGEIDELEIVQAFKLADYDRVVVEPFDTSATPLPEANDNTYAPVKNVLARVTPPFVEGLASEISKPAEMGEKGKHPAPGSLVVRGKVITMDPGSKAARYWAGFGAGAARTEIEGEVMDVRTGKVLLRFHQERRSGSGFNAFGGDYEKLMERSLRQIGEDVAGVLRHF